MTLPGVFAYKTGGGVHAAVKPLEVRSADGMGPGPKGQSRLSHLRDADRLQCAGIVHAGQLGTGSLATRQQTARP